MAPKKKKVRIKAWGVIYPDGALSYQLADTESHATYHIRNYQGKKSKYKIVPVEITYSITKKK